MPPSHESHHAQPDILAAIRQDIVNHKEWVARLVVLASAALAGGCVVTFTWLCEKGFQAFDAMRAAWPLLPFVWTPAVCAAIAWITLRYVPGTAGSGIPQVMAALSPAVPEAERPRFVSLKLTFAKIGLTAAGLFGGLAIGREGPAVQIAAGVMHHARRWLPTASISPQSLMLAGGAAGIAAAFNTPLAGVMFAIEELTRKIEQKSSGLIVAAIVLAGLIAVSVRGNGTYFGVIHVSDLDASFVLPALLMVAASGTVGGVFSRLLHSSLVGRGDAFSRFRSRYPVRFAALCGLGVAVIGYASGGATFGAGYNYTRDLLHGQATVPLLYVTLRLIATWLAIWSGVPGGLFAPTLAIGAGLGHDVAVFTGMQADSAALIALGMAGFLSAVTQAPITAFIIVMEMVDGHAMVLSLMAGSLGASLIARWIARPLYGALAAAQVAKLQAEQQSV